MAMNHWAARAERRKARPARPAWPTLKRALALHRPERPRVAVLLATILVASLAGLGAPLIIRRIIDHALPSGDRRELNILVAVMLAAVLSVALLGVLQTYQSNTIGQNVMYRLRRELYRHLSGMSMRWFTANRTGETLSRVNNDVGGVQQVVSEALGGIFGNLITASTTFGLMLAMDWKLALFCTAFLPLFLIPAWFVGNIQREIVSESQEQIAALNSQMQETLSVSGALLVKTFGRAEDEADRFNETAARIRALNIRRAMVGRWFWMSTGIVAAIGPAIVYWYGGHRVIGAESSPGTVVAFAALLTRLFEPVAALMNVNVTVLSSVALFERLFDYLDMEQEVSDRPGAVPLVEARGHVTFEHVSFSYLRGQPVLKDVSFDVPPGHFAALVGPSGAGKTTTAYLVPRLYDVDSGRVTVDGHDIRDVTLDSLGACIGMVNQEPFLFHDTIRENIRYGRPQATDDEVEAATRAANIHEFIAGLPGGYDTLVGERGYRLSGGEKQRVAIARALLKDPAILILDEATSSVDSRTERAIQDALEHLTRGRTVIAIAHRLSTVLAADIIVVVDGGRVVESGSHQELLERDGLYARLYEQQFQPVAAAAAK